MAEMLTVGLCFSALGLLFVLIVGETWQGRIFGAIICLGLVIFFGINVCRPTQSELVKEYDAKQVTVMSQKYGSRYWIDGFTVPEFRVSIDYADIKTPHVKEYRDYIMTPTFGKVVSNNTEDGIAAGMHYYITLPNNYDIN